MINGYNDVVKGKNEKIQGKKIRSDTNMGLGKLGDPGTIFVRKFRWKLTAPGLSEYCPTKVDFDFVNKTIKLDCLEVILSGQTAIESVAWLTGPVVGPMTFKTYDGCGVEIYEITFDDIVKTKENTSFDYASSEVGIIHLEFTFKNYTRVSKVNSPEVKVDPLIISKKRFLWTAQINDNKQEFETKLVNRPNLDIEEKEINYLGDKYWIPGKNAWQKITLVFKESKLPEALLLLLQNEKSTIKITMYSSDVLKSPLEIWTLQNSRVSNVLHEKDEYFITVDYDNVFYKSLTGGKQNDKKNK